MNEIITYSDVIIHYNRDFIVLKLKILMGFGIWDFFNIY